MKTKEQPISTKGCYCASNEAPTEKRRKAYSTPEFSPLTIDSDMAILTGSVMIDKPVMAKEVSVEEFSYGFSDSGLVDEGFDVNFE